MKKFLIYSICFLMLPINVLAHRDDDGKVVHTKKYTKRSKDGGKKTSTSETTTRNGKTKRYKKSEVEVESYHDDEDEDDNEEGKKVRRGHITGRRKFIQGRGSNDGERVRRGRLTGREKFIQ